MDYQEIPERKTVELVINRKVTEADFDLVAPALEAFIEKHDSIKLLEVVENFEGMETSLMLKGIRFDIKNLKHISHVAVVSDISWISPFSKAAGALLSTKLRTFPLEEIDSAREWLAHPGAE